MYLYVLGETTPEETKEIARLAATNSLIDFSHRMQSGEQSSTTPLLTENSKIADYSEWLDREDMIMPDNFDTVYAKF